MNYFYKNQTKQTKQNTTQNHTTKQTKQKMDEVIAKRESCGDGHGFLVSAMFVPVRKNIKKPYICGFNSSKTRFNNVCMTTHAEIQALNNLRYHLSKHRVRQIRADLYIFRKTRDGDMASSAPCHHCTLELAASKCVAIRNLYYFADGGSPKKIHFQEWVNLSKTCKNPHISRSKIRR